MPQDAAVVAPDAVVTTAETLRRTLQSFNVQREALEQESDALVSELTTSEKPNVPPMGIDTPLVDAEGYPRNDIDVFRARTLRQRLATLRTDHQQLMRQIESQLHQLALQQNNNNKAVALQEQQEREARQQIKPKPKYDPVTGKWVVRNWDGTMAGAGAMHNGRLFDQQQQQPTETTTDSVPENAALTAGVVPSMNTNENESGNHHNQDHHNNKNESLIHRVHTDATITRPFCRVESVAPASPAATAGLRAEDEIVAWGPHASMTPVVDLVRTAAAEQATIELGVRRHGTDELLLLQLKPRPWNGRGLLGCHIVPIVEEE